VRGESEIKKNRVLSGGGLSASCSYYAGEKTIFAMAGIIEY
jgi:hypothetical protein